MLEFCPSGGMVRVPPQVSSCCTRVQTSMMCIRLSRHTLSYAAVPDLCVSSSSQFIAGGAEVLRPLMLICSCPKD